MNIHPPPPPPINALATALTERTTFGEREPATCAKRQFLHMTTLICNHDFITDDPLIMFFFRFKYPDSSSGIFIDYIY